MSDITKVILYKHGVGYFERKAEVNGDAEVRLGFRTEEMNDVLKSLTVYDSGGGTVNSVSYDNHKPIARLLQESSLDVPVDGGGPGLLAAVRGASVMVSAGNRMISGQVVGVEERTVVLRDTVATVPYLTIYDEGGALHTFNFQEVSNVRFLDEHLKNELTFLFETLLSATKRDTKNLKLFARGQGKRELAISYVVECPVWKTSYRVALPEGDDGSAYLQGWALVDNPQDEDWKDVRLSLVSGLPISFTHDLYSPRYLKRKEIAVQREAAAGPVMTEGDLFSCDDAFGGFAEECQESVAPSPRMMMQSVGGAAPARAEQLSRSQQVETVTQTVGQLFEYRIDHPVTVLRNQSALVPIVGSEFEGRRKLLYNSANREENPFAVIDFKNTTGLTLEGGPLTVFEGDVYAGEAMLDTLGPDEERMLPYAVELSVETKTEHQHEEKVVLETLQGGLWVQRKAAYETVRYRFVNKSDKTKELVLEHPLAQGELLVSLPPASETRSFWRFLLTLEPKQTLDFPVTIRTSQESRVMLASAEPDRIYALLYSNRSRDKLTGILAELSAIVERLNAARQEEYQIQSKIQEIFGTQGRIRENLSKLGQSQDEDRLRSRYVGQLEAQEDQIASYQAQIEAMQADRKAVTAEVQAKVAKLSLETVFREE